MGVDLCEPSTWELRYIHFLFDNKYMNFLIVFFIYLREQILQFKYNTFYLIIFEPSKKLDKLVVLLFVQQFWRFPICSLNTNSPFNSKYLRNEMKVLMKTSRED
jgi:hypothetical protein